MDIGERELLHIEKVELIDTPNWKGGFPVDPNIPKKLCRVCFYDMYGKRYYWFPDAICRELNKILKKYIQADNENIQNLENPERRKDIIELLVVLFQSIWFVEVVGKCWSCIKRYLG